MNLSRKALLIGAAAALATSLALAIPAGLAATHSSQLRTGHATSALRAAETVNWGNTKCFGIIPFSGDNSYGKNCYGHDEPAIDPISSVPGSGQDVTWTLKLPSSTGERSLLDVGPTFWVGATLSDPSSLANSVFSELQFYPDSTLVPQTGTDINTACTDLGFNVNPAPGVWSLCDFSWGLYQNSQGFFETAAYVSVVDQASGQPLYLHSGDTVKVHIFPSGDSGNDAEQVITDVTTGQQGTLIMNSNATTGAGSVANPKTGDGPLTLPYSTNTTDNAMPWGVVDGTPFAFSWEIGHANIYTHGNQAECVPGQWDCFSYDTASDGWGAIKPLEIKSVTFDVNGQNIAPDSWATNDSQGGAFEDASWCGNYAAQGTNMCTFPWYTYNPHKHAILIGTNYGDTPVQYQYGEAPAEYATQATCNGPLTAQFGFLYYCDTTLTPNPPIK